MNLKEIVDLCKSGQAQQAYNESRRYLEANKDDRYAIISVAYGTKAMMEKAVAEGNAQAFAKYLLEYADLHLEEIEERELNNRPAWDVRALMLNWKDSHYFNAAELDAIFEALKQIAFQKPHRYYSLLLDAFIRFRDDKENPWQRLPEFVEWWGLENLLPEDFKRVLLTNGQPMPSLAERAYIATLKVLSEEVAAGRMLDSAEAMLQHLDKCEEEHPDFDNVIYRKSKLLKAMGRNEEAFASACAYARRRPYAFTAWSALGDVVDDDTMKAVCYSRAVQCKVDPAFLVKVRYKLAVAMYNIGEYAHSKKEFEKLAYIYESKGWHMPPALAAIRGQQWYDSTLAAESNRPFYMEYGRKADNITYQNVPSTPVYINMVNTQKMVAGFVTADRKRGFFSLKKPGLHVQANNFYRIRFDGEPGGERASKVIHVERVADPSEYEGQLIRHVEAEVGLRPGQTFQFIDDIYVDGNLLRGIPQGTLAEITAVLYYNIKKETWGWRAINVRPVR